jgi:hypothetical protein
MKGLGKDVAAKAGVIAAFIYVVVYVFSIALVDPLPKGVYITLSTEQVVIFALLTALPPIWFFIESVFIYGTGHGKDEESTNTAKNLHLEYGSPYRR